MEAMALPFDVCIRGAGIVGRTLALLLAQARLRVALVAGRPGPGAAAADVRAYALNTASRALLESVRSWPDPDHATPVRGMEVFGDGGGAVHFDAGVQGVEALTWIVDVPALETRLAEALRYQPLVELLDAPAPATLTVVCEGKASRTRAEFGVDYEVTPYPQHAIATRLRCEKPHGQIARQWFAHGEILAFLPLDGPQGNSVAIVWSVLKERVAQVQALADEDFCRQLEAASHQALGALKLASARAAWPLQLARAERWTGSTGGQSWALAGDAAHTVHPLAGQGLNLGLADAAALAKVLHEREYWRAVGDDKLLRRYERSRKAEVLSMGLATDGLQQLFALGDGPWGALRNWGMKGFEASGPLKDWIARRAMGLR